MRKTAIRLFIIALATIAYACKNVPEHIIQQEEMAQLMADMRVADAVVTVNNREFASREAKEALRQAVFDKHNTNQEQFDSSLVWYGRNIAKYQDVTERSIEILEERSAILAVEVQEAAMSIAGDSVDVWNAPTNFVINRKSPTEYLAFSFDADRNWEPGDFYTWRAKFIVSPASAQWTITAVYDDGVTEFISSDLSVTNFRTQQLTFFTDSTRTAKHISGWLRLIPDGIKPVIVDSVGLTRGRNDNPIKPNRRYQRMLLPKKNENDSIKS